MSKKSGILYAISSSFSWGIMYVFLDTFIGQMNPWIFYFMISLQGIIVVPVLLCIFSYFGYTAPVSEGVALVREYPVQAFMVGLLQLAGTVFVYYGCKYWTIPNAAAIESTYPLVVVVLLWLLRRGNMNTADICGIVFVVIGIAVMYKFGSSALL